MAIHIYARHDSDPDLQSQGMIQIRYDQAPEYNQKGFGIFWTVNEFKGARRISNLQRIRAWAVDMDTGSKAEMIESFKRGLIPSVVVETKRGFQAYWIAKDPRPEHWKAIVADRLVPFYNGDKNARDLARVLRVPGFLHLKDPSAPFLVRKVWEWPVTYSELQMATYYPSVQDVADAREVHELARSQTPMTGTFWERVWHLNCEMALERLSGHELVNGELYSFRSNSSGTKNIYVDGKATSCWIDREGRIGSLSGGGPTVFQWLTWLGVPASTSIDQIKILFPETRQT